MSELPRENQELDQDVDPSRRKLAKIGAAAPVIMTLASQPVFGAQCLSQMMSGNASHQDGSCSLGWSPGGWKNAVGTINGIGTIAAWVAAGFAYSDGLPPSGAGAPCSQYTGGTPFNDVSTGFGGSDSRSMREILCTDSGTEQWHCIAALLNASSPSFNYVLTKAQVLGLCDGSIPLPAGYSSLNSFLDSTWI